MERNDGKHLNNPRPNPVQESDDIKYVWERKRSVPSPSYAKIAEEMDCSVSRVHKLMKKGLALNAPPALETERALAIERLSERLARAEGLYLLCGNDVEMKFKALELMNKLDKEIRTLQGLDARVKFDVRHKHTSEFDAEVTDLMGKFDQEMEDGEMLADKRAQARRERFNR